MLKFKEHLSNILTKGSYKINTLSRITPYMSLSKKRIPMHSFFTSQICYCPLVWMFYIHKINNKINSLHKRRLKVIYNDKTSSFEELFEKDRSVSIHTKNLQILAREMFKVFRNMSPPIICEIFHGREINYESRNFVQFSVPYIWSVHHRTVSVSHLGPKIWEIIPNEIKELLFLNSFKNGIRKWKPSNWTCRHVKITFRTSVSCNLLTICANPPSLTLKQKKDYWEMRTEGTCTILYNIFHAPSPLIPTFSKKKKNKK